MPWKTVLLNVTERGEQTDLYEECLWPDFRPRLVPVRPCKAVYRIPIANVSDCGDVSIPMTGEAAR